MNRHPEVIRRNPLDVNWVYGDYFDRIHLWDRDFVRFASEEELLRPLETSTRECLLLHEAIRRSSRGTAVAQPPLPQQQEQPQQNPSDNGTDSQIETGATRTEWIAQLIERAPRALVTPNKNGNYPLHCVRPATPVEVVELLWNAHANHFPANEQAHECSLEWVAMQPDADGDLPIHCAIQQGSIDVIKVYTEKSPLRALVTPNKEGRWPLHEALYVNTIGPDVSARYRLTRQSGNTYGKISQLLDSLYERTRIAVQQYLGNGLSERHGDLDSYMDPLAIQADSHGRLPVHNLVNPNSRGGREMQFVVDWILRRSPPAALLHRDEDGYTPLHRNLLLGNTHRSDSMRTLHALCRITPPEVFQDCNNESGFAPLHLAIKMFRHSHLQPTDLLVKIVSLSPPNMLEMKNPLDNGSTVLHMIVREKYHESFTTQLIDLCSDKVHATVDNDGRLPIHCVAPVVSIGTVKQLLRRAPPGALLQRDTTADGHLPIHCLLERGRMVMVPLVAAMAGFRDSKPSDKTESILTSPDNCGRLPLHHALLSSNQVDVIEWLIDHSPKGVFSTPMTMCNRIPLQCSLEPSRCSLTLPVMKKLVDLSPPDALERPIQVPMRTGSDVNVDQAEKSEIMECWLLHRIGEVTPIQIISYLVQKSPILMLMPDSFGKLPIHWLLERHVSPNVIAMLLENLANELGKTSARLTIPDCISEYFAKNNNSISLHLVAEIAGMTPADIRKALLRATDKKGRVPLHFSTTASHFSVIKHFVEIYPEALYHADEDGRYPLHAVVQHANQRQEHVDVFRDFAASSDDEEGGNSECYALRLVRFLAVKGPDALLHYDSNGRRPLHLACHGRFASSNLVRLLMDVAPSTTVEKSPATGALPLHVALQDRCNISALRLLYEGYPDAVRQADNSGKLPLHYAAQYPSDNSANSLRIVEWLLEQNPVAATLRDHATGLLPFQHAAISGASLDVIYTLLQHNPRCL